MRPRTTKRWWACVAGMALLAGVMTGCGSSGGAETSASYCPKAGAPPAEPDQPDSSTSGSVTVWGWNNAGAQAVVKDFKKAYPKINVKLETVGYPDILPKLTTALQAGTGAPDIAFSQDADAPLFWKLPIPDISKCMKPHLKDFPAFKQQAVSRPDGTVQAVPWEAGPTQLLYRRDIFKKYGIDPKSLTTWDAYIAAGKKLVADSNGKVHMMMSNVTPPKGNLEGLSTDFRALMQQNGGNLWTAAGKATFGDPKAIAALNMVKRFRDEGITLNDAASDQATYDTMVHGTVASFIAPTWWTYYPKSFAPKTARKWGGVPLPAFRAGGARSTNEGGTSLMITKQSKNKKAAWAFLNFWLLRGDSRKLSYQKGGYLFENIYRPIANDSVFNQPDPFLGGDHWLHNAAVLAPEIPKLNVTAKSPKIDEEFTQLLPAFVSGKKDAQTTLKDLKSALDSR